MASLVCIFIPRSKKIIVHWHSDIINTHGLSLIIRILENNMLRRAQHIIVATEIYAKNSNALLAFKNKITYIPYGINKQNFIKKPTESKFYNKFLEQFKNKKKASYRAVSFVCPFFAASHARCTVTRLASNSDIFLSNQDKNSY